MLKRFFITGTDTSVGKTVVSRALLRPAFSCAAQLLAKS